MGSYNKRSPERLQQVVDAYKIHGTKKAAADACGLSPSTFKDAHAQAVADGYTPSAYIPDPPDPSYDVGEPEPEEPADHVEMRKLRDQLSDARNRAAEAERRAADAEDYRSSVMGLVEPPPKPQSVRTQKKDHKSSARTVLVALSDIHFGEVVDRDEMDGLNCYNQEIAKTRLARLFDIVVDLTTEHWTGAPADEIIVWIGGDLISGALHPELVATDDLTIPEGVRTAGEHIAGGLVKLATETQIPVRVYESPGNHGRATQKPQSKLVVRNSFDTLAVDFAEVALKHTDADVTFYRSRSMDAMFNVYDWRILCTHGDRMGTGGGKGFIGAIAPITRGHKGILTEYADTGTPPHIIMTGHFHTTVRTPFG